MKTGKVRGEVRTIYKSNLLVYNYDQAEQRKQDKMAFLIQTEGEDVSRKRQQVIYVGRFDDFDGENRVWFENQVSKKMRKRRKQKNSDRKRRNGKGRDAVKNSGAVKNRDEVKNSDAVKTKDKINNLDGSIFDEKKRSKKQTEVDRRRNERRDFIEVYIDVSNKFELAKEYRFS